MEFIKVCEEIVVSLTIYFLYYSNRGVQYLRNVYLIVITIFERKVFVYVKLII